MQSAVFTGTSLLLGCSKQNPPSRANPDTLRGVLPFTNDGPYAPVNTLLDEGLDGRLYTGIESLTNHKLVTPNDRFFIRTRYPQIPDPQSPWSIRLTGMVERETTISLDWLMSQVKPMGVHLMECAGNTLMTRFRLISAAKWSGVPIDKILAKALRQPQALAVVISGHDQHAPSKGNAVVGASWYLPINQLVDRGAFLATHMNDQLISRDHGQPVRLFVPGWYGCACIKWVNEIRFVDDTQPATSQMIEYADRTHQTAIHSLAKDYRDPVVEHSAVPVRVEQHMADGQVFYRIVGVMWGGSQVTDKLVVRCDPIDPYQPVRFDPKPLTTNTWALWSYDWRPTKTGSYTIELKFDDPTLTAKRTASGYFNRQVQIASI